LLTVRAGVLIRRLPRLDRMGAPLVCGRGRLPVLLLLFGVDV